MDKATVSKVAKLARIRIAPDKLDLYAKELSNIMKVVDELGQVDTSFLEPLVNVNEFAPPLRKDVVTDGNCAEKVLKNAPQQKFGYFVVPKVVE